MISWVGTRIISFLRYFWFSSWAILISFFILKPSIYLLLFSRYFIQLSAIKSPDISGRQNYRLGIKDISFSPQCLGLGVPENTTSGCKRADMQWSHDMDLKELAMCYGESFRLPLFFSWFVLCYGEFLFIFFCYGETFGSSFFVLW